MCTGKVKVIPQQAEVAQGVPGRLRPRIFLTFGTTRLVGRQPYAPAAFTPGEIPGTHFQRLSRSQGTWFLRGEPRKKSPVKPPGIDSGTVRLVAQCLNHYATPGPDIMCKKFNFNISVFVVLLCELFFNGRTRITLRLYTNVNTENAGDASIRVYYKSGRV
jgi:hypothetical protein